MKQADADNLDYRKSKPTLFAAMKSMTSKELDEKLSVHRSTIESKPTSPSGSATATASTGDAIATLADTASVDYPLCLWKYIVHVVTAKTAGNKRTDRDKLTVEFSTIRQRPNESLSDFHHRMSYTIEIFEMLVKLKQCALSKDWTMQGIAQCKPRPQTSCTMGATCTQLISLALCRKHRDGWSAGKAPKTHCAPSLRPKAARTA
jgi:hypothetical protein